MGSPRVAWWGSRGPAERALVATLRAEQHGNVCVFLGHAPCCSTGITVQYSSRARGATFVEYMIGVALAIVLVVGGVTVYKLAIGKGTKCLGQGVAASGKGGSCEGAPAPLEMVRSAATMAQLAPGGLDGTCDSSGKCTNGACFAGETLVLTPQGDRPIASIVTGDIVMAKDVESGVTSARKVLATKITLDKPALRLELRETAEGARSEVIAVTAEHPFWVPRRGWVAAADLESDDVVTTPAGTAVVVSLAQRAEIVPVHNLEVEGVHTYFVGRAHVLVHNDCDINSKEAWSHPYTRLDADRVIRAGKDLQDAWKAFTARQNDNTPSMHAPGFDVRAAKARDFMNGMSNLSGSQGAIDARMAQILTSPNADRAAKAMVAQALADGKHTPLLVPVGMLGMDLGYGRGYLGGMGGLNPSKADLAAAQAAQQAAWSSQNLRLAFAQYASREGTPEMKAKAVQLLALDTASSLSATAAYDSFAKKLQYALQRSQKAEGDSELKSLARLLYIKELAKDPKWGPSVSQDRLAEKLEAMWKNPVIKKTLAELHKETISEVKSSNGYRNQIAMLESDAFLLRLQLEGPDQAKKTLETELGKVAAVDQAEAKQVLDRIIGRQLMNDFHALDLETQSAAVEKSIDAHLATMAKHDSALKDFAKTGVKAPADVMKRIAKVLSEQQKVLAANRAAEATAAIDKIVEDAAKAGQITGAQKSALSKVFNLIEKADHNGHVSAVATTAGLLALGVDVYNGEAFKTHEKAWSSGATMAKSVGSIDSYAKVGAWVLGAKLPATGKFATALKISKFAGPLGDAITVYLDGRSAVKAYEKGYTGEAVCDAGAATCAVATTIAGIAIASGATGPAAPIVMLVGTVGYLGFKGIKWMVTDADEIKMIKEAGVFRDMSGSALAAVHEREIRKYANSCTSDRRHCSGPIGEEARRILDGDKNRYDRDLMLQNFYAPETGKLRFESMVIAERGAKFYEQHKAAPGTCNKCH